MSDQNRAELRTVSGTLEGVEVFRFLGRLAMLIDPNVWNEALDATLAEREDRARP